MFLYSNSRTIFRQIFFSTLPPLFYRVFCTKGSLTARFVAELTKDKIYRKRKESLRMVTNRLRFYFSFNNNTF